SFAAKRGNFHLDAAAAADQHYAEMRADRGGIREERQNLRWGGVGADIVIFRGDAKQAIANAAAHQIGLMAVDTKSADDVESEFFARMVADRTQACSLFIFGCFSTAGS